MKYINEKILLELGIPWPDLLTVIEEATCLLKENKIAQPVKPYLRFNDPANRIIAMPAYIGGKFNTAGIKWIASFPGNISKGIKRAHSILILNDAATGRPSAVFNTALLSGIRTAGVSGFVLKKYLDINDIDHLDCGIIGFGPIGQLHLKMLSGCFSDKIRNVYIYDTNGIKDTLADLPDYYRKMITVCRNWEDVYENANLFMTCTVSKERYVNRPPKKGAIYLNVSLRDFHTDFLKEIDINVVDNWDEICRESTDIEHAHLKFGLARNDVLEITDIFDKGHFESLPEKSFMFNPMGMAIYDVAVAKYYQDLAIKRNEFVELED